MKEREQPKREAKKSEKSGRTEKPQKKGLSSKTKEKEPTEDKEEPATKKGRKTADGK